jgi:hypothetical protein
MKRKLLKELKDEERFKLTGQGKWYTRKCQSEVDPSRYYVDPPGSGVKVLFGETSVYVEVEPCGEEFDEETDAEECCQPEEDEESELTDDEKEELR